MFPYSTYLKFSNTPAENQDIRNTKRIFRLKLKFLEAKVQGSCYSSFLGK